MLRDWFRCEFIVDFHISQMVAQAVTQPAPCFSNVSFSTYSPSYAVDKICDTTSVLHGSLRTQNFIRVGDKRARPTSIF